MPAEDACQPQVMAALQKDGWTILRQQIYIPQPDLYVFIDIEAKKDGRQALIEVKCFPEASKTTQFYAALGQYLVYRQVISTHKPRHSLYLAVPEGTFAMLGETYLATIRAYGVNMIVVNIETEEVTQWIG